MNEIQSLFLLNASSCLSPSQQNKIISFFGTAKAFFENPRDAKDILNQEKIDLCMKRADLLEQNKNFLQLQERNIHLISKNDPLYPDSFHHVKDPPIILYVKGNIQKISQSTISIIGTRTPDLYGRSQSIFFTKSLVHYGFHVVSGLAKGIDAVVLNEAVQAKQPCSAILGCGIDQIYPKENKQLYESIERLGCVISEFPPETAPLSQNFPWRNRLVSALGKTVFVIQASLKSGTSSTVKWALEQGKDIFALPGPVNTELSKGPNMMIRDGAMMALEPEDIIEYYQANHYLQSSKEHIKQAIHQSHNNNIPDELKKLGLSQSSKHIEELMESSKLEYNILTRKLNLEIAKGIVERLPGGRYKIK